VPATPKAWKAAERAFRTHRGVLRTSQAIALGVHPRVLYALRDAGRLQQLSRGVYRLSTLPDLTEPDLATVASRVPNGVICLISALAFHGLTTQIPHVVDVALPRGTKKPRLDFPPIHVNRFSGAALTSGIETRVLDGIRVRVYGPAKTVADCFKFRNRIGLDVALEALRDCLRDRKATVDELVRFAKLDRVWNVMRPYMEALA
jgi:predicted transcriptional regulator of viral defense system